MVLKEGAKFSDVEFAIKADSYFSHDDTRVLQVPDIDVLKDMGHGVLKMCIRDRNSGCTCRSIADASSAKRNVT